MAKANPGKYITGPVSLGRSTAEQGLMQLASGITSAYGQTLELGMKRDLMQQALIDKENLSYQNMYDKINKIPETGVANLDKNINSFFNTNADKIFEIKKHMKNGDVSLQEGNKAIQQLTNYIDEYADLAPKMIAQAQYMKEAMKDGTLSRVNVDGLTAMMMGIADNSADIELVEKDGQMYLTGSGNIKTSEGEKPWNYNINLAEFKNIVNKEGYTIARTIPTIKDIGLDAMFEAQKSLITEDRNVVSRERRYNTDTQQYEYVDVYNKEAAVERFIGMGVFKDLLRSNDMDTVWADVINRGQDASWVKENQWDPNNAEMAAQAERWFANKAVERNIPGVQLISTAELKKPSPAAGFSTGGGFQFAQTLFTDVAPIIKEFTELEAFDPVEGENIDGKGGGAAVSKNPREKLTPTSITLDPAKAIDLLQKYTDGQSFYTTLDANSKSDLLADAFSMIDALTEDEIKSDYSEFYVEDGDLDKMKKDIKKAQGDSIERTIQSLTPNDPKSRQVVVIRKGELKPTKVEGNIYSVLKEIIENTNYVSGKDVGYALNALNIFTNPNQGGFDVNKWGDYVVKEEIITDPNRTIRNSEFNSNQ